MPPHTPTTPIALTAQEKLFRGVPTCKLIADVLMITHLPSQSWRKVGMSTCEVPLDGSVNVTVFSPTTEQFIKCERLSSTMTSFDFARSLSDTRFSDAISILAV